MNFGKIPAVIGKYQIGHTLGKGAFSVVKMALSAETDQKFAIKILTKENVTTKEELERFEREVKVIIKMEHPGIIKIHDFIIDENYFYLVMDYCPGGTLLSKTENMLGQIISLEEIAKPIFKQLLETISYIHDSGIAHRDLKLENILLDDNGSIKIIDFGFSRFVGPGQMVVTPCGSPAFAAPEIVSGLEYDGMIADMWSVGVILFSLVTGELPWNSTNQAQLFNQIRNAIFDIPDYVSPQCADLIKKFLVPEPMTRLTAKQAMSHPWLEGINVSWDEKGTPLKEHILSANTFDKILTNQESVHQRAMSPRSQLANINIRGRSVTKVGVQNLVKSPLSFGGKQPSPLVVGAFGKLNAGATRPAIAGRPMSPNVQMTIPEES